MLNCIIIADDVSSKLLTAYIAKSLSLHLVGIYNNDSVSILNHLSHQNKIDIAIIDVKIVGQETIDIINNLRNKPNIIGLSSDGQYALNAFTNNFIDYIIKPVSCSRFYRAIDKAIRYNSCKDFDIITNKEIYIKKDSVLVKMKINEIAYIEALENYIIICTIDKKYIVHFTMKGIENQIPSSIFQRVHRSFIVNKKLIKTINENYLQIMIGDNLKELPIGNLFRDKIMNDLSILNK
jgi:DNA-binding LytR/AlgR family response regulator